MAFWRVWIFYKIKKTEAGCKHSELLILMCAMSSSDGVETRTSRSCKMRTLLL